MIKYYIGGKQLLPMLTSTYTLDYYVIRGAIKVKGSTCVVEI